MLTNNEILKHSQNNVFFFLQIHNLILNYIIEEMRPLNTIYKPAFRNLICGIANNTSENILPGKCIVHSN